MGYPQPIAALHALCSRRRSGDRQCRAAADGNKRRSDGRAERAQLRQRVAAGRLVPLDGARPRDCQPRHARARTTQGSRCTGEPRSRLALVAPTVTPRATETGAPEAAVPVQRDPLRRAFRHDQREAVDACRPGSAVRVRATDPLLVEDHLAGARRQSVASALARRDAGRPQRRRR
jgi:hypothetical protein